MKYQIVIRFEAAHVSRRVLNEVANDCFVQLEGLSGDYGVEYDKAEYSVGAASEPLKGSDDRSRTV